MLPDLGFWFVAIVNYFELAGKKRRCPLPAVQVHLQGLAAAIIAEARG